MLYEFNKKIYVKPFSNKLVEVEVSKNENGYDVEPTKKTLIITPEIKNKIIEVTLEQACKRSSKKRLNTI